MLRLGSILRGYAIEATDGTIGSVCDFLFDDRSWKLRWIVVDTGSWLVGRKVLLHPSAVAGVDDERKRLQVHLTMPQVKASPGIAWDDPVSAQMQDNLYRYYGWDPYWGSSYFGSDLVAPALAPPQRDMVALRAADGIDFPSDNAEPHLRSAVEVTGYHLKAADGAIGHVEDLLVDDANWGIGYLLVDTRDRWFGQHVLISPHAVQEVIWADREVLLNVTREKVKASPPWDPVETVDMGYQERLHGYYGWPGYGW